MIYCISGTTAYCLQDAPPHNNIPLLLYSSHCHVLTRPIKGSPSPMQRCTGVPQATQRWVTDSCPPSAPSAGTPPLSASCSSVPGCNTDSFSSSAYLACPSHTHCLSAFGCLVSYLAHAQGLTDLSATSTILCVSNLKPSFIDRPSSIHNPCQSVSTLGKSPGSVCPVRPHLARTVGELHAVHGATERDTCQWSRHTKQVL